MFKNLWYVMNDTTYAKWQALAIASGIGIGWVMCDLWKSWSEEARDAGAIA